MSDTEREESADAEEPVDREEAAVDREAGEPRDEGDAAESVANEESVEGGANGAESAETDPDAIAERVADADPEEVAREIAALRERTADLENELEEQEAETEDLESRLKRKQAEFQNYKKRQEKRREKERARATEDLVERLVEVRDNLSRALEQEDDADIREGVEATFRQLEEVLAGENVEVIEPGPGTDLDPQRHEVLLRVESDQPPGTVDDLHRPGYEMAEKVLRAAQVTVAEEGDAADDAAAGAEDDAAAGVDSSGGASGGVGADE